MAKMRNGKRLGIYCNNQAKSTHPLALPPGNPALPLPEQLGPCTRCRNSMWTKKQSLEKLVLPGLPWQFSAPPTWGKRNTSPGRVMGWLTALVGYVLEMDAATLLNIINDLGELKHKGALITRNIRQVQLILEY